MKHTITSLCLLAGISFGTSAFAQTATFNNATRYLTIPSVQAGTTIYSNVVVRLDSFAIISVGSEAPVSSPVADTCLPANFTYPAYNAITLGMTPDQVNQTIGCKLDPSLIQRYSQFSLYYWAVPPGLNPYIGVHFDLAGTKVTAYYGNTVFKQSSGF